MFGVSCRVLFCVALFVSLESIATADPSVAFFYGRSLPVAELARFDWVVVEPDHVVPRELDELHHAGVEVFAYLSLGEDAKATGDAKWILGRNTAWGSAIVDPRAKAWRERVLARVDALRARGY